MKFNFYSNNDDGHRREYADFTQKYLHGTRVSLRDGTLRRDPLLFLMVEDDFFKFFIVSVVRSLFGLKTSGLTFRAHYCIGSHSPKHIVKFAMMKFLNFFRYTNTISIIPFEIEPRLKGLCRSSLYDFQFWDLSYCISNANAEEIEHFYSKFLSVSAGKILVSAIGKQNKDKGVDSFIKLYNENENIRSKFCFLIAGKITDVEEAELDEFVRNGGIAINRYVSDEEIFAVYKASGFIWCAYSPSYDQSSGVLGRALQFGKTPIVRSNSVAERICNYNNIISIQSDNFSKIDLVGGEATAKPDGVLLCSPESFKKIAFHVE
jgi:glycosyltransferase involved in cell wall biosynthesis